MKKYLAEMLNFKNQISSFEQSLEANPLWQYFKNNTKGPGIWKWEHYFEAYQRHLSKFIGKKINLVEIGIYSGGSLGMWRSYFGNQCHVHGIDIEAACMQYASKHHSVYIGDQADRTFWKKFRQSVPDVDILIDDGGHTSEQQQVTLEEMLEHLRPGGVYICEDIHGENNAFADFAKSLVSKLNNTDLVSGTPLESKVNPTQVAIHSIHFYPYLMIIEKHLKPCTKLVAPKMGTEWQPFL